MTHVIPINLTFPLQSRSAKISKTSRVSLNFAISVKVPVCLTKLPRDDA